MAILVPNGTNSSGSPLYPLVKAPSQQIDGATPTPIAIPGTTTGTDSGLLPQSSVLLSIPPAPVQAPTPIPVTVALINNPFNLAGTAPAPTDVGLSPLPDFSATLNPVPFQAQSLSNPSTITAGNFGLTNPNAINNTDNFASNGTAVGNPKPSDTGSTPVVEPQVRAAIPPATTLPVSEMVYQIPFFLQSVLSTPAGALPKGPLWIVTFEGSPNEGAYIGNSGIPQAVLSINDYEPGFWNVTNAINTICSDSYMKTKGCILVQNVNLPGEQIYHTTEGLQYNGFIRGIVGNGRQDFETLRIGFLNTNVSFVDNVIRPWTIMTGHKGMIARSGKDQYRTNITVRRLGTNGAKQPPFILQTFTFYGACPISVDAEEYTTTDNETAVIKTATFVYQWYTVDTSRNVFAQGNVGSGVSNSALATTPTPQTGVVINPPAGSTFPSSVTPYNLS